MMVEIKRHTEGDTRVATEVPTLVEFDAANKDHVMDVISLCECFIDLLRNQVSDHDWTKLQEPYRSMFYHDLSSTIKGEINFEDGEWCKLHYTELERHHLNKHCPKDVTMIDVLEMIFDCVAAGLARSGKVRPVEISTSTLQLAVKNTVEMLIAQVKIVE